MFEKIPQINLLDSDKYALVGGLFGIIDSAMDAIITINEEQRIIFFNPAAEQMFGCKAAEVLGSRVDRFIPERFRKAHEEHIRKFGETGQTSRRMGQLGEIRGLRTTGEEFPIEASISQVSVGGRKLFSVILRDITERKQAEEALKESQRREQTRRIELETLMETVPLPVWVSYDRDCRIMTGNRAAYELLDLAIGSNISETAPDGQPHFTAYKDGQPVTVEDLPMQKAARTGNAALYGNAVPLRDENENVYGALGAFMDVTERKQMETAIETSERKFRAIYEQAPLGVALIDSTTGHFLQVNRKYCEIAGRTEQELLKVDFQAVTHPEDLQADLNNMELLREGKIPYFNMEKRYIRPDGSIIWVALTVVPMWEEGEPGSIHIAMVMDITERKQAEEERLRLLKQTEDKNKELQSIVYVVSHDLRSPLLNIHGFTGELADEHENLRKIMNEAPTIEEARRKAEAIFDERIPEHLAFIEAATHKLDALIKGMLTISRLGTVQMKIETLDMNALMEKVVKSVAFEAREKGAKINVRQLPPCRGDANQINQLFANIVGNAVKYLDPNRPGRIHVTGRTQGSENIYSVCDNGIGIAEGHKDKVFEIFHRLNPQNGIAGEGLGLSIVLKIVDRHGGRIWLNSNPGKGSTFHVALPAG
jgi:chemotaxis family two-component system sensor kinase Cph1